MPRAIRELSRRLALPVLFVALLVGVWAEALRPGRNFVGRDLEAYNLPVGKIIHDAYARGELPLWCSEISGGRPFLPNPNVGALYPVRVLLALLPLPWMARLYPVVHWALGGIGIAVLLGSLRVGRAGQWLGAVTYVFSGVFVSEVFLDPHLAGTALLPWIVWVLRRIERPISPETVWLGFLLGLDLLAGDVFAIGIALIASILWIAFEASSGRRAPLLAALAVSLALGFLLAAPQVIATALWIPHTARAVIGLRLKDILGFSVSPWRLSELLIPYPFGATASLEFARMWGVSVFNRHPGGLHATLYAGAFAALAVPLTWFERRRGASFARALLVTALALCVAPSLLPRSWEGWRVPVPLRNPEKFAVGAVFALAILAGFALERLRAKPMSARIPVFVAALLAVGALAAKAAPRSAAKLACGLAGPPCVYPTASRELPLALAEAGVFWLLTAAAVAMPPGGTALRAASLALLTFVPIAADHRIVHVGNDEELFAQTAFARWISKQDPAGRYRVLGESYYRSPSDLQVSIGQSEPTYTAEPRRNWLDHTSVLWGRGMTFNLDFDRGDLVRLERLRRIAVVASRSSHGDVFFGTLAQRWGIRYRDQVPLPGYNRLGGDSLQDWDELRPSFPDIRLLTRWQEVAAPLEALNQFSRLRPGEVVVESGRHVAGAARPGLVRILEETPNRLALEVESPDPAWLFVLRNHWPYRRVLLDKSPVPVHPAQIAFSAVEVPAGRHRVDWREELAGGPFSFVGPLLFVVSAAFVGLAANPRETDQMTRNEEGPS